MTESTPTSGPAPMAGPDQPLDAPIVAVTVFPDRARVTRRGGVRLPGGEVRVVLDGLPLVLQTDSVRVSGTGPATVLGVDINRRHRPRTTDEAALELEEQLRQARAQLAALDDDDAIAAERLEFFSGLARRATRTYASALAAGDSDPARAAELADALAAQQATVRQERRALAERRDRIREQISAYERGLEARRRQREPDRLAASVALLVDASGDDRHDGDAPDGETAEVELDVSYVVVEAGWHSTYDVRLDGGALTMTWYGLVTQRTGEDWPECDLRLSTARPSSAVVVPELDPWFLDRYRPAPPMPPPVPRGRSLMPMSFGARDAQAVAGEELAVEMALAAAPVAEAVASVEQGVTAATYQPVRPVAVPADGGAHRATVTTVDMDATLDYVTAPVRAEEAHLRATVTNSSSHTLLPGPASVFHSGDFVGSTTLEVWAPGEEVELALGVDDRVRVERELVGRSAAKAVIGSTRRREAEYKITISNHTPRAARISVLDQIPVSRDDGIVVKEQRVDPDPAERTDLGVLTWRLDLDPGESKEIHLGIRVEQGRGVEIIGWRE